MRNVLLNCFLVYFGKKITCAQLLIFSAYFNQLTVIITQPERKCIHMHIYPKTNLKLTGSFIDKLTGQSFIGFSVKF